MSFQSPRTATARVIDNLALYGHTPNGDDHEQRPIPADDDLTRIVTGLFEALAHPLSNTALEPELPDLLWSLTDLLHRKADRLHRFLDDNELKQRDAQAEQDGSEIRSVQLERLIEKGQLLVDKRSAFEFMREAASTLYHEHTGSTWRPRSGSMVNHKAKTAAVIDSRDFIAAKRRSETEVLLPTGPKIAFTGGLDCNDHASIWAVLDKVREKHPDMVLIHEGTDRGAPRIADAWAASRKVPAIPFKPNWARDQKAAPFKRNDAILELMPIGVVAFKGNGITDNMVDKAKKLRIPVIDHRR